MKIEFWNENNRKAYISFLNQNIETSMFMLQNIEEHGPFIDHHQNSGDFYTVSIEDEIKGVFVLTLRGNILFQLDQEVRSQKILKFLSKNIDITIKGVLGDDIRAVELWSLIKNQNSKIKERFKSSEILYTLSPSLTQFSDIPHSRLFSATDFATFLNFTKGFYQDLKLRDTSSDEQYKERFDYKVKHQQIWCLEYANEVVSMCALNAKYKNIAQVGGVYTSQEHRSKGYSKKCMGKLIHDCLSIHAIEKIILFTAADNIPAQKVYEKLGFERVGYYGMYFGEIE